ncbi:MAG: DUF421 domain-containing protein [Bacilli bacterium]
MYFKIMIITAFFYFYFIIIYRFMGKREIGQLGMIDFIVTIFIAEIAAIPIIDTNRSLLDALIPITVVVLLQFSLAILSLKSIWARKLLDGRPSIIIKKGVVMFNEMVKQRYNLSDLLLQLREQGIKNIKDVEYAVLEHSGKLSVFQYEDTNRDYPMPFILDGIIQQQVLKEIKKNDKWVNKILMKNNVSLDNVFYAFLNEESVYIIKKSDIV